MRQYAEVNNPCSKVSVRLNLDIGYNSEDGFQTYSQHRAHSTTLNSLLDSNVDILILTHLSGGDSVSNATDSIEEFTGASVRTVGKNEISTGWKSKKDDEILLYENLYDLEGSIIDSGEDIESTKYKSFVDEVSSNVDAHVNDSFSLSHMSLPSTTEISKRVPSYAGRFFSSEVEFLKKVRSESDDTTFLFSGTNISESLNSIRNILSYSENSRVATSGLISLVFLEAKGYNLGSETQELITHNGSDQSTDVAYEILTQFGERVYLPSDVATYNGRSRSDYALSATPISESIKGIGSETFDLYEGLFRNSDLVVSTGVTSKDQTEMELYEKTLNADHSIVAGSKTISSCDEAGLTGFSHTTYNPIPLIQFLINNKLPAVESLLS